MLRCKLKRTEEKLKHYVKENILLKTKKELHYFSSVYDEEIRKIVEEVLRRYHSNHNPKPKRSLQPKMLMV